MAAEPKRRRVITPDNSIDATLKFLGAKPPTIDEVVAIRAITRGHADASQQRRAITYILGQLCNVGGVTFTGENTNTGAFRAGAQAVGVSIALIGDAVLMRFPIEEEKTSET